MRQPTYSRGRRAARLLGLTRNPLCRRVDRLEGALRIASVLAVLVVTVVTLLVGVGRYHRELDRSLAAQAELRHVPVVLLTDATAGRTALGSVAPAPSPGVEARWTLPDGSVRTGTVYSPVTAPKGTTVRVWMDAGHVPVRPPVRSGDLRFRVGVDVLGCVSLFSVLSWGLYQWGRSRLDRRRDAEWTRSWLVFERQGRHRSH
ncbi:Rv1733c family protein [Cryptosporangium minutisporangium]|uniref:Transmembrane protein n=1 Tax=Cryptosporangium minutisporangium TaxID=113569 RepID=A0ABP6T4W8_9ACTN